MVMSTKVGAFNITTAGVGSTQAISDVGFEPKATIFWQSGNPSSTDNIAAGNGGRGVGFAASTTSRRTSVTIMGHGYTTTEENIQVNDAACINQIGINGADEGAADLQSFDAGGFTLVVDVQFVAANRIHYMALGGDSLTNSECFTFQLTSGTGNQSISTLSFKPDCVIYLPTADSTAPPTQDNGSTFALGVAVSTSQRAAIAVRGRNNVTTTLVDNYCLDIEAGATFSRNIDSGTTARFDLVSFDTNGFTINKLESDTQYVMGIALKGGNYAIKPGLTQTDTVTDIPITGVGFRPAGGLVLSHCQVESTQDTMQSGGSLSMGGFTSATDRGVHATRNQNGVSTTNVATVVEHDEVYCNINQTTATVDALMDVKSMDSDGVTFIMDDADDTQKFFWALFFGPAPEPPAAGGIMTPNRGYWGA